MSCAPKLYVIQYSHVFTRFQILGSQFFFIISAWFGLGKYLILGPALRSIPNSMAYQAMIRSTWSAAVACCPLDQKSQWSQHHLRWITKVRSLYGCHYKSMDAGTWTSDWHAHLERRGTLALETKWHRR